MNVELLVELGFSGENLPQLCTTNPACPDPGSYLGHCDGKPAANCLSCDMACGACYVYCSMILVTVDTCFDSVAPQSKEHDCL
jgi:hypothetical protein